MNVGLLFLVVATVFLVLFYKDYRAKDTKFNPAQKTWLIIAFIFFIVGVYNLLVLS